MSKKITKFVKKQKFAIGLFVGALVFTCLPVFAGGGSIVDKIIDQAALIVAQNINTKINDSGVLDNLSADLNSEEISVDDLTLGSVPGSSFPGPSFSVNGVEKFYYRVVGKASTTTPASIKCPGATTTIESLTYNIHKVDATANYYDFATSTTAFATTSVFANLTASASTKYNKVYLEVAGTSASECAPNTYIVVKAGNADVGSSTLNVVLRRSN